MYAPEEEWLKSARAEPSSCPKTLIPAFLGMTFSEDDICTSHLVKLVFSRFRSINASRDGQIIQPPGSSEMKTGNQSRPCATLVRLRASPNVPSKSNTVHTAKYLGSMDDWNSFYFSSFVMCWVVQGRPSCSRGSKGWSDYLDRTTRNSQIDWSCWKRLPPAALL